ncbi:MAG: hypothetical protein M3Y68_08365 [Chloroflexota bacterium]|nr:hypothetical protein [Chloroflexota bacterium]
MARILMFTLSLLLILGASACSPVPEPTVTEAAAVPTSEPASPTSPGEDTPTAETEPSPTEAANTEAIPVTGHLMTPADVIPQRVALTYDVESAGTSAPYGDSYRINRFERPFEQDMTYVPELDILRFEIAEDADWYYISIGLNGSNINSALGIHYGVELDRDADGFGDFMIWASPSYTTEWTTNNVQVFEDTDQDTAGRSSSQAEPGFEGNGYDTKIFDGEQVQSEDPDLAWTRMVEGGQAMIQFAFKKSWAGASFVVGVVSDAGIQDVSMYDYNDRFEASQAGSPLRNDVNYPLGPLYGVDNTCWQPYNLELTNYQPKFCPPELLPVPTRRPPAGDSSTAEPPTEPVGPPPPTEPEACVPPDENECGDAGYDPDTCQCNPEEPTPEPTEPQPPEPTACEPTFDPNECGDIGYDPDTCQCNLEP